MEELIKLAGKDTIVKSISIYNTNDHLFTQEFAAARGLELIHEYVITDFIVVKYLKDFFFNEELEPIGCFIIKHKDGIDRVNENHITNYIL